MHPNNGAKLASVLFLLLFSAACTVVAGKPAVMINSPAHGAQFRAGEDVAVQSIASDAVAVTRVELVVDGALARSDSPPNPKGQPSFTVQQIWKATPGSHTIIVRAYNASGQVSDPVGISISVLPAATVAAVAPTSPVTLPSTKAPVAIPTTIPVTITAPLPSPPACINNSSFISDVTAPPGASLAAGQTFNKIWRIRNDGTCAWDATTQFLFLTGEAMTTTTTVPVPNTAPGATADVLVAMAAPATPGLYSGQWQLRGPAGPFGTAFGVTINVVNPLPAGCPSVPTIAFFEINPKTVAPGESSVLSWGKVEHATSAVIDQGIGGVTTPGALVVKPGATTTYTLTATGCGGTVTKQVTITVGAAP